MLYTYARNCAIYNVQSCHYLSKCVTYMCWAFWESGFFVTYDETKKLLNIYKVKLQNSVQDLTLACSNVKGKEMHFCDRILYFSRK